MSMSDSIVVVRFVKDKWPFSADVPHSLRENRHDIRQALRALWENLNQEQYA